MAPNKAHTSAEAAGPAKFLLINTGWSR